MTGNYVPAKDMALKIWKNDDIGLIAAIYSYNKGTAKFQVGPRIHFIKDSSGNMKSITNKAGRLTKEECQWLKEIWNEVIDAFNEIEEVMFVAGEYTGGVPTSDSKADLTELFKAAEEQQKQREDGI
jgi:hypothetical protein